MHPNDPALRSFVEVDRDSHFPIQNLPYGVFATSVDPAPRAGAAIGDCIIDLAVLEDAGMLAIAPKGRRVFDRATLNDFIALGQATWSRTRARLSQLLRHDNPELRDNGPLRQRALVPMTQAELRLPVAIPGYTDFYSSKEHATNVGMMFRDPKNALLPNWLEIPIAYNGRASSVVISGSPVRRPNGQTRAPDANRPTFGPCRKLDFELETALIVGEGNSLGEPIPVADAERRIFGMVLLNDWSARDIQQWESAPLGPFNSKSFATSISPWIVTLEALAPFRAEGPRQEPEPLAYLRQSGRRAFDIELEARLRAEGDQQPTVICRTNFRHLYWSMAQQLAHHTVGGCNARVGDLMGSGTISGPTPDSFGSLLELTWNGKKPLALSSGKSRAFLEDGDEVVIAGWCRGEGYRVGFGEVWGRVLPARTVD